MFKQRFFTAVVLIALVLLGVYYTNYPVLMCILAMMMAAMGWEWAALIPLNKPIWKIGFILGLFVLIWPIYAIFNLSLLLNFVLWVGITAAVLTYPTTKAYWGQRLLMCVVAWFSLALFVHSVWALFHQEHGRAALLYILGLVWATDTGAYLCGKLWGVHRMIPRVSPGKTFEGALGGVLFALCVAGLGYLYFRPTSVSGWFVEALLLIAIAMMGDLWMSVLKRRVQIKDTGHFLPGHGGLLDRLDSLIATLPFFYYFYQS